MPQVLTTNAQIMCPHGGLGTSIPTAPTWSINGGIVLLEGDTGTLACPFILHPCVGYQLRSMGLNSTKVNGRSVILTTDFNQTFTGLPLTMIETHPVIDNTSPAPLPASPAVGAAGSAGGGAASAESPLPPELTDMTKPMVMATPPALAFNSVTMMPPTIAATFTLFSPFPMQWILTLINGVAKYDKDVSKGEPPGLIVVPPGDTWSSPSLVVVMTLTAPYMASLGIGVHHFFMTGVSQRGLTGFAEVILTVS